jgi:MscS family membrane protein
VSLRYETTADQLRSVVDGIRWLLESHPSVDATSVRVRFLRLGSSSLEVDVSAYAVAPDWNHFTEIQEQLLLGAAELVERSGTRIAVPP